MQFFRSAVSSPRVSEANKKKNDELLDPDKLLSRKNFLSPKETLYAVVNFGVLKITYPWKKLMVMGYLAAMFVAMGATVALIVSTGAPDIHEHNPGVQKLLYGAVFPVGLILVLVAGGELFTGNVMTLLPPLLMGRISFRSVLKNWSVVYLANFIGSVCSAYFLMYLGGFFHSDPFHSELIHYAEHKIELGFGEVFVRGISCNFLVCLATFVSNASLDITGKILGTYFPAMAFATSGFEHSIANMFIISLAMMEGAEISVGEYIGRSVIPSTLGNMVGGGLFVGIANWYIHTGGSLWWKTAENHGYGHTVLYEDKKIFDADEMKVATNAVQEEIALEMSTFQNPTQEATTENL
eukprot:TRINITY_DN2505_c0_g1_i1.p1 TRINITY_DN2505_c0_g1~~TRINITY_DN2505_c0_g1_i1.p1  ORF type:complete len:353 (+),score=71.76 TRINITY_DN2505_c0_g1_i1:57-1115(+)